MDIVVMPVMVPSNRVIGRVRRDRGGDHGHNEGGGAEEFQSDHLSLLTTNDKTTRGKLVPAGIGRG
jgi:hypothetical protein